MWKIAAIGECMLELSNPGGAPLSRNMALQFSFGGDTLNTAIYLARQGVNCSYVTALGDDPYSSWMLREWHREGCNPESCNRVVIENYTFDTGDDCIAIKSGRNNDGRRINTPCQNILIQNCGMFAGHGGIVLGSEIFG